MSPSISATSLARLIGDDATRHSPAYRGLADALRMLIVDGRVLPGSRLPSERDLTGRLPVSRTTVTRAYDELRERGYVTSRRGSGSVAALPGGPRAPGPNVLDPGPSGTDLLDLTCAAPAAAPGVAAAYAAAGEQLPGHLLGPGYQPLGLPELRTQIARRFTARGLPTDPDQILVTAGALAALAVVVRAFAGPGVGVLMESPGYPNAIATVRRSGARLVGVPCPAGGLDPATVETVAAQARPAVAVLVPDFQNPTGTLLGDDERAAVAHTLRRRGVQPVVDETLCELGLTGAGADTEAGPPLPAPFAASATATVTVGSASKSHWGGLRLGWIRAPREHLGRLTTARLSLDLGAPVLEQLALTHLLAQVPDGAAPVTPARRTHLRAGRDALVSALATHLPDWSVRPPDGGLSLWCRLPQPRSTALVVAAERLGVLLAPGSAFATTGRGLEDYLRLPFTRPVAELTRAVEVVAQAWAQLETQAPATRHRPRPIVA